MMRVPARENKCPVDGETTIINYPSGVQKKIKPKPSRNTES
jgi:hypothetical protein